MLDIASCSKFYSTSEVLAAVFESDDEDLFVKNIGFMGPSVENINKFLYSHTANFVYMTCLWRHKVKWSYPLVFSVRQFYIDSKYLLLYKVTFCFWEICCIFCITTLWFFKIWCGSSSYMQSIFSQIENSTKTKFCILSHKILVLWGYKVEKTFFFSSFLDLKKQRYITWSMTSLSKIASTYSFFW